MDRKPYNGFDPRYSWPPYTSHTWYPVSGGGGGWSRQVPIPPGAFYFPDPGLSSIFANPAATFTRQQHNMSQEHASSASPTTAASDPHPERQGSPPVSHAGSADADADAGWGANANANANADADSDAAAAGTMVTGQSHGPPSTDLPRLSTDRALEQLTRQLDDALHFCEECVKQHEEDIEKVSKYLDEECRNGLWSKLLASKFKDSERDRHLFNNLQADIQWCLEQTVEAAAADLTAHGDDGQEKSKCENVAHEVRILAVRGEKVIKHAQKALGNLAECKHMIDEMTVIKVACESLTRGEKL